MPQKRPNWALGVLCLLAAVAAVAPASSWAAFDAGGNWVNIEPLEAITTDDFNAVAGSATTALPAADFTKEAIENFGFSATDADTLATLSCTGTNQVLKWDNALGQWGCADDADTSRTDAEILDIVSDAGYLTDISEGDPTVPESIKDGISWDEIADIPADIADGDADTVRSDAEILGVVENAGYITEDTDTTRSDAEIVQVVDDAGYVTSDSDVLAGLLCQTGGVAKWNGSAWECAVDENTEYDLGAYTLSADLGALAAKNEVESAEITDGTIQNEDIAADAGIEASKILGLGSLATKNTVESADMASDIPVSLFINDAGYALAADLGALSAKNTVESADIASDIPVSTFVNDAGYLTDAIDTTRTDAEIVQVVDAEGYLKTDSDTLATLVCQQNELAKWNGSAWECSEDKDTDTTRTDAEIQALIDAGNFLTSFTEEDPTVPDDIKDGISWSEVSDIPADIADGDADTTRTDAEILDLVEGAGYLTEDTDTVRSDAEIQALIDAGNYLTAEADPAVADGISSAEITDGTIQNEDIAADAGIEASKILGLGSLATKNTVESADMASDIPVSLFINDAGYALAADLGALAAKDAITGDDITDTSVQNDDIASLDAAKVTGLSGIATLTCENADAVAQFDGSIWVCADLVQHWADITGVPSNITEFSAVDFADNTFLTRETGGFTSQTANQVRETLFVDQVNNTADLDKPISTATQAALDAKLNTADDIAASQIVGLLDVANIPAVALGNLYAVANEQARYALTTAEVQNGDTVHQTDTNTLFLVQDQAELQNENGYQEYTANTIWEAIQNKPEDFFLRDTHTTDNIASGTSNLFVTTEEKADIAQILRKDNAESYTPTLENHPATKGYADTLVAELGDNLGALAAKDAVESADIVDGTITNADIAADAAIEASKILDLGDLAAKNVVESADIVDGTIVADDLAETYLTAEADPTFPDPSSCTAGDVLSFDGSEWECSQVTSGDNGETSGQWIPVAEGQTAACTSGGAQLCRFTQQQNGSEYRIKRRDVETGGNCQLATATIDDDTPAEFYLLSFEPC